MYLQQLQRDYPFPLQFQNTTLFLRHAPDAGVLTALRQLIDGRKNAKRRRFSSPLAAGTQGLFAKIEQLDTFKTKLRVTWHKSYRDGRYEWPIEELLNTAEANRRGAHVPPLVGYGHTKSGLGLTREVFLLTELLDDLVDGKLWLKQHPDEVGQFIATAFTLLDSLLAKNITHMDFWAANLMISPDGSSARAIDLENGFSRRSEFFSETLGFQMGFFYYREIHKFITERHYDALVEQFIATQGPFDRARFEAVYQLAKHEKVGRKERRDVFLSGKLVIG
ncbi:hypothetical protein ACVW0Y_000395 [Pseudomonas sp. TE3786]